jgi:ElaB/YqjD/DUF883 family membrane-anchored ribosome-binding protein
MNSALPVDVLERKAAEQRRQIHDSVVELRHSVKERLEINRIVQEHLWGVAGTMAAIGLVLGYAVAGVFTRD